MDGCSSPGRDELHELPPAAVVRGLIIERLVYRQQQVSDACMQQKPEAGARRNAPMLKGGTSAMAVADGSWANQSAAT